MLPGRDAESARLVALLDAALNGESGALVLIGEAGIGKTALLADAADEAKARSMQLATAVGIESEAGLPFAGLVSLLRPLLAHLGELPPPQAAALSSALALGPPAPGDPFAIGAGTLSLLAAAADDRPLLVVVDDAHWLPSASQQALLFAARRFQAEPIAVLLAVREEEHGRIPTAGIEELLIGPLPREAADEVVRRSAGAPLAADVLADVYEATNGNPLALIEAAASLTADELSGRARLPNPLPLAESVERAFERRLAGFDAETRLAVLAAAAGRRRRSPSSARLSCAWAWMRRRSRPSRQGFSRLAETSSCFGIRSFARWPITRLRRTTAAAFTRPSPPHSPTVRRPTGERGTWPPRPREPTRRSPPPSRPPR